MARLAVALGLNDEQQAQFAAAASRRGVPKPAVAPEPGVAPPRQLPAAITHFTGRATQVKALVELLEQSTTVVVSAISGMAGIGKTAFAIHWGHQVSERFPDGQLYVDLRGFDPVRSPMCPTAVVRSFLEALGVPPHRFPASPEAQVGLYRSLLAGRRMLVVLDNAFDAEQVRPLLPGTSGCLVLVTSRNQLTSLAAGDGAHLVILDLLTEAEAHELLVARLSADRVAAEPRATDEIIARSGRLPLALAIVAARAAANPEFSLAALAKELCDAQGSLDAFHGGDATTNARAVFSWSYQALPPDAAHVFRLLGIHPGPDISTPAAASLTAMPIREVAALLAELARANLVLEHKPGRYTFHDLLRAYAGEQAHARESDDQRTAAVHRMLDHYLHTAHAGNRLLTPSGGPITLTPPQPGTVPEQIADHRQALDWFATEHPVLLAIVDFAVSTGWATHTWQLAWTLTDSLSRSGHWHDDIAIQRAALAAARELDDPASQARAHRLLALDHNQLGSIDEAHTHLKCALDLAIQADDAIGQAHTHNHFAVVCERQGRHDQTLHHARQALILFQANGQRTGEADALNAVGWSHGQLGDYRQALTYCEQSRALHQELGNRPGQAAASDSLGYAHHHLGNHEQALTCYHQALQLHRELGNRYYEADVLTHLGDAYLAVDRRQSARAAWQQALAILTDLDHPGAEQVQARLRGPTSV